MKFISYNNNSFKKTEYYKRLPKGEREIFDILSSVFHFKVNNYVLEHLIDWRSIPDDPIYKLIFPRKEMLSAVDYEALKLLYQSGLEEKTLMPFVQQVKKKMYWQKTFFKSSEFLIIFCFLFTQIRVYFQFRKSFTLHV